MYGIFYCTLKKYLGDINVQITQESKLLQCFTCFSSTVSNIIITVATVQKLKPGHGLPQREVDRVGIDYCTLSHK